MTRCIDCGGEIIEGEDHRCHTLPPIIVPVDTRVHTDSHPYCSDATCPCRETKPERGTHVLIEVEIRDYYGDSMLIPGGWMPVSRIKGIAEAEDHIGDVPPSEAELDLQEQDSSDGTWVNGDEEDPEDETGTHSPDCRCYWCEPQDDPITSGPRRIDWNRIFDDGAKSRDRDQQRNVTHQCADGSWW
jgi:hypothetical protein